MNKRKMILKGFLTFALVLLPVSIFGCASSDVEPMNEKPTPMSSKRLYEESTNLRATIYYPVFEDYEELTNKIKTTIDTSYEEFKQISEEEKGGSIPYEYNVKSDIRTYKNQIISIKITENRIKSDNNKKQKVSTICFDRKNNKYLTLSDVSSLSIDVIKERALASLENNVFNSLNVLDEEVAKAVRGEIDILRNGSADVFNSFILEGEEISFYFNSLESYLGYVPKATIKRN